MRSASPELHEIVSRVMGRLFAEPGGGSVPRTPGVFVSGDAARPASSASAPPSAAPLETSSALVVAVGSDHGGFQVKAELLRWIAEAGHRALDLGTRDERAVDYPDFAHAVALAVVEGRADLGVCLDGAGIGSAMAANKVPGIRAANGTSVAIAKNAREHNYANLLTLGARLLEPSQLREILLTFLKTPWGEARHGQRVAKITALEARYNKAQTPGGQTSSRAP